MADGTGRNAVFTVDADQIGDYIKALRKHTDKTELVKRLNKGLEVASEKVHADLDAAIPKALPKRGGLGVLIQRETKWTTVVRSGRYAGLWVRGVAKSSSSKKNRDLKGLLLAGAWRHPLFGNKGHWYFQTAGADTSVIRRVIDDATPELSLAALEVMEDVAREIVEGV